MRITDTHETAADHFDYLDDGPELDAAGEGRPADGSADAATDDLADLIAHSRSIDPASRTAGLKIA